MQTLQPSLKSGRSVWNAEALPRQEFQSRVCRLQAAMTAKGLDLVFVYGTGFNNKADQAYLTNFVTRMARGSAVAVPREGMPAVFFEGPPRGLPSFKLTTWVEDVRAGSDIGVICGKYLGESQAKSVGLVGVRRQMPFRQYRTLREALAGRQVVEDDSMVSTLRLVKSERELGRIRKSGAAVAAIFAAITGPKVEATERGLDAKGRLAARLLGAEDVRLFVMRPGEWALRPAGDGQIAKGERVLVYASAEIDRYWAEGARTFVATDNGLAQVDAGETGDIYGSMLKAVAAGKKAEAPVLAAAETSRRFGIKLSDEYGCGNGMGLSLDEAPIIAAGSGEVLEAGMALSLRLFTCEQGGLMLGDTLIVQQEGSETMTQA